MAKLIGILAASVGGGIALGAGIRLGEAIAGRSAPASPDAARKLLEQLGEMENRLQSLEHGVVLSNVPGSITPAAVSPTAELRGWVEENVAAKMAEVETRLREDAERSRKEMLDALVEGVQSRVAQRISRVEDDVARQSAALSELRDCSLRTERSVQQLLGGIDKLIVAQPDFSKGVEPPEAAPARTPQTAGETPPAPEPAPIALRPGSGRWRIFG